MRSWSTTMGIDEPFLIAHLLVRDRIVLCLGCFFFPEGKMKHELSKWLAEMLPNTRQV